MSTTKEVLALIWEQWPDKMLEYQRLVLALEEEAE